MNVLISLKDAHENIEFLKSMERRHGRPKRALALGALCLLCVMACAMPEASARSSVSKAERARILEELTMQVEAALPYEEARSKPLEGLVIRGDLPALWRVELITPSSWRTTRVQAKILDVEQPERPAAFVQATLSVEIPVYQATGRIEAGAELQAAQFTRTYVSLYEAPHDAVTSLEALTDKIARRAIAPGYIVGESVLDDPVIFKRGDLIKIRVRRGSVELVDTGMAMESGKLNHTVRVKSTSTDAVLSGVVRRDGVVF